MLFDFLRQRRDPYPTLPSTEPWRSFAQAYVILREQGAARAIEYSSQIVTDPESADEHLATLILERDIRLELGEQDQILVTILEQAQSLLPRVSASVRELANATVTMLVGSHLKQLNRNETALKFFMESAQYFEYHGFERSAYICKNFIAPILTQLGDYPQALRIFESILSKYRGYISEVHAIRIRINIANLSSRLGKPNTGINDIRDYLNQQGLHVSDVERLEMWHHLAVAYLESANYTDAVRCFTLIAESPELPSLRHVQQRACLGMVEICFRTTSIDEARRWMQRAHRYTSQDQDPVNFIVFEAARARFHALDGDIEAAFAAYRKALETAQLIQDSVLENRVLEEAVETFPAADLKLVWYTELVNAQRRQIEKASRSISEVIDLRVNLEQQVSAFERRRNEEMMNAVIAAQDQALADVGSNLHDSLGQELTVLGMKLQQLLRASGEIAPSTMAQLHDASQMVERTRVQVRDVAHLLTVSHVTNGRLAEALRELAARTSSSVSTITVEFVLHGRATQIPDALARCIYRSAQSLLQNVLRHAQANHVDMQLQVTDDTVEFSIEDDGIGFDVQRPSEGLGLREIAARAQAFGGTHRIESAANSGTYVLLTFPCSRQRGETH